MYNITVTASPNCYFHKCSGTSSEPVNAIPGFLRKAGQKSPLLPLRRTVDELQVVAEDTISRTPKIIAATPGASADSIFHDHQLPSLNKDSCLNFPQFTVRIGGLNVFTTTRKCIRQDPTIRGKVAYSQFLQNGTDAPPSMSWAGRQRTSLECWWISRQVSEKRF